MQIYGRPNEYLKLKWHYQNLTFPHTAHTACDIYSAVAWQTFHEHIVPDAFRFKKSSSALLVH